MKDVILPHGSQSIPPSKPPHNKPSPIPLKPTYETPSENNSKSYTREMLHDVS